MPVYDIQLKVLKTLVSWKYQFCRHWACGNEWTRGTKTKLSLLLPWQPFIMSTCDTQSSFSQDQHVCTCLNNVCTSETWNESLFLYTFLDIKFAFFCFCIMYFCLLLYIFAFCICGRMAGEVWGTAALWERWWCTHLLFANVYFKKCVFVCNFIFYVLGFWICCICQLEELEVLCQRDIICFKCCK